MAATCDGHVLQGSRCNRDNMEKGGVSVVTVVLLRAVMNKYVGGTSARACMRT